MISESIQRIERQNQPLSHIYIVIYVMTNSSDDTISLKCKLKRQTIKCFQFKYQPP